ncbi:hypothetical protein NMG60_11031734 [Bertholletia excelsa]
MDQRKFVTLQGHSLSNEIPKYIDTVTPQYKPKFDALLMYFAFLWQRYLQSMTARLEAWRIKRTDTKQWMHHRQLPLELRQAAKKCGWFKWVAIQGVDEEAWVWNENLLDVIYIFMIVLYFLLIYDCIVFFN